MKFGGYEKMHETSGKYKLNYFLGDKHPELSDSIVHLESVQSEWKFWETDSEINWDFWGQMRLKFCIAWTIKHGPFCDRLD